MLDAVEASHALSEDESDLVVNPKGRRPEREAVRRSRSCEQLFRERRSLVGRHGLLADEHDVAFEALRPKRFGAAGAGEAGAHHQD